MSGIWRAMAPNCMKVLAPAFAVTLVCSTSHLYVSPNTEIRHASFDYRQVAAIDTSSSALGIADSSLYFMTADELNTAMDAMAEMGVTQVRFFIPWRDVEATEDTYDWDAVDAVVEAAAARGIAVVAVVTTSPTWASDQSAYPYGEVSDVNDYAEFMRDLASRYGAGDGDAEDALISAYEIWNEPQNFLSWFPSPSAEEYTELLKAAYTAIKEVDPTGTVVAGAVTAGTNWGDFNINPVDFVEAMYEAGAAGYFDAISYHPYNYTTLFSDGEGVANSAYEQLLAIQELMAEYGDGDKQVWTTEYGIPTTEVSDAEQAQYILDFLETWSTLTGVGPSFLYSLIDLDSDSTDRQDNFGLFNDDWTAKDVVAAIEAWLAGETGTETPPSSETPETNVITQLANAIKAWANSIVGAVQSVANSLTGGVQDLINTVVTTIKKALSALTSSKSSTVQAAAAVATADLSSDTTDTAVTADSTAKTASSETGDTSAAGAATTVAETTDSAQAASTDASETAVAQTSAESASAVDEDSADTTDEVSEGSAEASSDDTSTEESTGEDATETDSTDTESTDEDTTTEVSSDKDSTSEGSADEDSTSDDTTTKDTTTETSTTATTKDSTTESATKQEATKAAAKDDADTKSAA